jgi:hypothetical protein
MVGTGRFELPTPRTPSECSTRLSHVPTRKDSADAAVARGDPSAYSGGVHWKILHYGARISRVVILSASFARRIGATCRRNVWVLRPEKNSGLRMTIHIVSATNDLLQISPVRAYSHIHLQGDGEGVDFFHVLAN